MFMPTPCFHFYAHACINYLLSDQGKGDSAGADGFFGIVEIRKDDIQCGPADLRCSIRELLRRLGDRQAWYDAEPEIYGSFRTRADTCLKMIEE